MLLADLSPQVRTCQKMVPEQEATDAVMVPEQEATEMVPAQEATDAKFGEFLKEIRSAAQLDKAPPGIDFVGAPDRELFDMALDDDDDGVEQEAIPDDDGHGLELNRKPSQMVEMMPRWRSLPSNTPSC